MPGGPANHFLLNCKPSEKLHETTEGGGGGKLISRRSEPNWRHHDTRPFVVAVHKQGERHQDGYELMHCDHLIFHRHEDLVAWRAHVHCRDSTHVLVCVRLYNGALTYGNATNSCFSKKVWPNKTRFSCCQIWFRWLWPRVSEQITERSVLLILIRDPKPHAGFETKYSLFYTLLPGKMSQMVARQKHTTHRNRVSTVN